MNERENRSNLISNCTKVCMVGLVIYQYVNIIRKTVITNRKLHKTYDKMLSINRAILTYSANIHRLKDKLTK